MIDFLLVLLVCSVLVGCFHEEVIDTLADMRDYWRMTFGPVPPTPPSPLEEDQPEE